MNKKLIEIYLIGLENHYFMAMFGKEFIAKIDSPIEWYKEMYQLEADLYDWDNYNRNELPEMLEAVLIYRTNQRIRK